MLWPMPNASSWDALNTKKREWKTTVIQCVLHYSFSTIIILKNRCQGYTRAISDSSCLQMVRYSQKTIAPMKELAISCTGRVKRFVKGKTWQYIWIRTHNFSTTKSAPYCLAIVLSWWSRQLLFRLGSE